MSPVVRVVLDVLSVGLSKLLSRPTKSSPRVPVKPLPPKQRAKEARRSHVQINGEWVQEDEDTRPFPRERHDGGKSGGGNPFGH